MHRLVVFNVAALLLTFAAGSKAEMVGSGTLRVSFTGSLSPRVLPRDGVAPISVRVGGRIFTTDASDPPSLRTIEMAINRQGRLDPQAVPSCRMNQIQPATTRSALQACGRAQIGRGSFSAAVAIPGQAPFPTEGEVTVFNGRQRGRSVVLLHIYGVDPVPTSLTVPLRMRRGRGDFGTVLQGRLPAVSSNVGFVRGLTLQIGPGRRSRPYLSAGCPAPKGFSGAVFPLARASFTFAGQKTLSETLIRSCKASRK